MELNIDIHKGLHNLTETHSNPSKSNPLNKHLETINRTVINKSVRETINEHHKIRKSINVNIEEKSCSRRHQMRNFHVDSSVEGHRRVRQKINTPNVKGSNGALLICPSFSLLNNHQQSYSCPDNYDVGKHGDNRGQGSQQPLPNWGSKPVLAPVDPVVERNVTSVRGYLYQGCDCGKEPRAGADQISRSPGPTYRLEGVEKVVELAEVQGTDQVDSGQVGWNLEEVMHVTHGIPVRPPVVYQGHKSGVHCEHCHCYVTHSYVVDQEHAYLVQPDGVVSDGGEEDGGVPYETPQYSDQTP